MCLVNKSAIDTTTLVHIGCQSRPVICQQSMASSTDCVGAIRETGRGWVMMDTRLGGKKLGDKDVTVCGGGGVIGTVVSVCVCVGRGEGRGEWKLKKKC